MPFKRDAFVVDKAKKAATAEAWDRSARFRALVDRQLAKAGVARYRWASPRDGEWLIVLSRGEDAAKAKLALLRAVQMATRRAPRRRRSANI